MTDAVEVKVNGRWPLMLPLHRAEWEPLTTGWEVERLDSMYAHLGPGDVVYDIGAEEGDLPALWASWVGDEGGVVLVEPCPWVWPNIRYTFEANDLRRPLAAYAGFAASSPRPGWESGLTINSYPDCAAGEPRPNRGFMHLVERPDIPTATIDLLAWIGRPPTAITIDVEGSELQVLRGADRVLARHRPLVWVSIHTDAGWMAEKYPNDGADAVHEYMAAAGYDGMHLATDHEEHWMYTPR